MYLYMHISPSGRKYIGITKQEPNERWKNGKGYKNNPYFERAIKKYGWDNFQHIILFDGLTEDEANELEKIYIDMFDTTNPKKGYNLHTGGNHHTVSERSKEKYRKTIKGRYVGEKNPFYGKHHSQEVLDMMRIRVEKYSLDGEYIETYASVREAAEKNNTNMSDISKTCRGVRKKTCQGFQWKFENDPKEIKPYRRRAHNCKTVLQIDVHGAVIRTYQSLTEAGKQFGTNADKCIGDCCRGDQLTAYGYRWEYG